MNRTSFESSGPLPAPDKLFGARFGPVFGLRLVPETGGAGKRSLERYLAGFAPLLHGIGLALVLIVFLKETGPAGQNTRNDS